MENFLNNISPNVGFMVIFTEDNLSQVPPLVHQKGLRFRPTWAGKARAFGSWFLIRAVDRQGRLRVIPGYVELEQMTKLIQGLLDFNSFVICT